MSTAILALLGHCRFRVWMPVSGLGGGGSRSQPPLHLEVSASCETVIAAQTCREMLKCVVDTQTCANSHEVQLIMQRSLFNRAINAHTVCTSVSSRREISQE